MSYNFKEVEITDLGRVVTGKTPSSNLKACMEKAICL